MDADDYLKITLFNYLRTNDITYNIREIDNYLNRAMKKILIRSMIVREFKQQQEQTKASLPKIIEMTFSRDRWRSSDP